MTITNLTEYKRQRQAQKEAEQDKERFSHEGIVFNYPHQQNDYGLVLPITNSKPDQKRINEQSPNKPDRPIE